MIMRDPLLLRIRHAHRTTGRATTGASIRSTTSRTACRDAIEGITHSLCTLEFKDNNDIYDWLVREAGFERPPEQTEFARLELDYTVMSKRKLLRLVNEGHVSGWDDPRMPTIAGHAPARRDARGDCATSVEAVGVSRKAAAHRARDVRARDPRRPQHARAARDVRGRIRSRSCSRTIRKAQVEELDASYYPHDVPLTGLATGAVLARALHRARRLHGGSAEEVLPARAGTRSAAALRLLHHLHRRREGRAGEVVELRCTYDPATRGGDAPDGRKVQGTIHWVSARTRSTARCGSTTSSSRCRTPRVR